DRDLVLIPVRADVVPSARWGIRGARGNDVSEDAPEMKVEPQAHGTSSIQSVAADFLVPDLRAVVELELVGKIPAHLIGRPNWNFQVQATVQDVDVFSELPILEDMVGLESNGLVLILGRSGTDPDSKNCEDDAYVRENAAKPERTHESPPPWAMQRFPGMSR